MKKLVVYLDQNFISDIAKLGIRAKIKPLFESIFERLALGYQEEKFVVPKSWFHREESNLAPAIEEPILRKLACLGHVQFRAYQEIQGEQFYQAAEEFLGKKSSLKHPWNVAFCDDPNKPVQPLQIITTGGFDTMRLQAERQRDADAFNQMRKIIRNDKRTFDQQVAEEKSVAWHYYERNFRETIQDLFASEPNPLQRLEEFFNSGSFWSMPWLHIYIHMWSKIWADNKSRKNRAGDFTDVKMISAYLPYCDALATDSFMREVAKQLGLDKKYQCRIFSAKNESLAKFDAYLAQELSARKSANTPIKDREVDDPLLEVFGKIVSLQNKKQH